MNECMCMKISIVYSIIPWICVPVAGFFLFQQVPLLNFVLCQIALGFRYELPMKPSRIQIVSSFLSNFHAAALTNVTR